MSKTYRNYILFLLTAVYTFNFIDRQIIGIISPALKADLGLSDSQLGLLKGFAFAIFYTALGIPIARLADRANRVTIISVSLALWSGFTAISGFAQNFAQLAIARIGVGVGEAGGSPPSHSIISDLYPKEKRAGALAVFALGIPVGIAFAYLAGGYVTTTYGWRQTLLIVGLPGIVLALLLKLTVREPKRGASDDAATTGDSFAPDQSGGKGIAHEISLLLKAASHLLSIPSYRYVLGGITAASFASYAMSGWIVDFFSRTHADYPITNVYFALGVINGTAYAFGVFVGGQIVDKMALKDPRAYGLIPALALLIMIPFFLSALWADSAPMALLFFIPVHILIGFYLGPCFALAQTLAPISIRALSTAIFFFILNLIALGLGPTYIGYLSDILIDTASMNEETALRISLSTVGIASIVGALYFFLLTRSIGRDWEQATR